MKGIDSRAAILDRTAERIKPEWIDRGKSAPKHAKYLGNPIAFIEEVLGDTLTIEQKQILDRVRIGGEINVQAAHGVGKSFIASRIVVYQTIVVGTETITTAPTFRQVKNVLWKEVRKLSAKVKKLFAGVECGQVFMRSGNGSAFGFTAQHNSTDAFQGQHASGLGVVIDEACGVSKEIDEGAIACAVDAGGFILRIGNPTNPNTPFAKSCKGAGTIKIPVWNHPNVSWAFDRDNRIHEWVAIAIGLKDGKCLPRSQWAIGNRYEVIGNRLKSKSDPITYYPLPITFNSSLQNLKDPVPGAVSIEWICKVEHKFGRESAYWLSRVCAEFPDNASDGIIPYSWLLEARARYDRDPDYWDAIARDYWWNLGLDVADGGGDRHALAAWRGKSVLYGIEEFIPKGDRQDTMRIAGIAAGRIKNYDDCQIAVDNLGVGAGTLGRLREQGYLANACTFSESPTTEPSDGVGYRNLRTQLYWEFREGLQSGEIAIAPLGEEVEAQLFEELAAIKYDVNSAGIICAQAKKEIKKELGRSPDLADAVVIGRSLGEIARSVSDLEPEKEPWEREEKLDEMGHLRRQLGV